MGSPGLLSRVVLLHFLLIVCRRGDVVPLYRFVYLNVDDFQVGVKQLFLLVGSL